MRCACIMGRMGIMTLQQAVEQAVRHQNDGQLAEAESLYREILSQIPDQPESLHGLGGVLLQTGRVADAVDALRRAAALKPDDADAQYGLGMALMTAAHFDDAIVAFQ